MRAFLFFLILLASAQAEIKAVYLSWYGDPTTTMTIQWISNLDETNNELRYKASQETNWHTTKATHTTHKELAIHQTSLTSLQPDTEYQFILSDEKPRLFKTAPPKLTHPLRFVVGGDAYGSRTLFTKMTAQIAKLNPLFVVIGGDIAYALSNHPFHLPDASLKRWLSFLQDWTTQGITATGHTIPFLIVPGNHDIAPDQHELFFQLFAFPSKQLFRALDFGSYLSLILLDTGHFHPIEGRQTLWLKRALSQRTQIPNRFAIYHEAAYPSFYPYTGPIPRRIRTYWCPLFDRYSLSIAFENHNHAYKETFPIFNNQIATEEKGVLYLGDGSWGVKPRKTNPQWYLKTRESKNAVYFIELTPTDPIIQMLGLSGELTHIIQDAEQKNELKK